MALTKGEILDFIRNKIASCTPPEIDDLGHHLAMEH